MEVLAGGGGVLHALLVVDLGSAGEVDMGRGRAGVVGVGDGDVLGDWEEADAEARRGGIVKAKLTARKPKPKMMDAATFLRKLGKLKGNGWNADADGTADPEYGISGLLRCGDGWCPILALYREQAAGWKNHVKDFTDNDGTGEAARLLRIPTRLSNRIIAAADGEGYDSFRRRLLTTLGLA